MNKLFFIALLTASLHMQTQAAQIVQSTTSNSISKHTYTAREFLTFLNLNHQYEILESRLRKESQVQLASISKENIHNLTLTQLCLLYNKSRRLPSNGLSNQ